ncbi:large conductance mechanosensitive channel protein MscL [Bdellovibrio reynosensis]|uniref:Large-conductance mechanosensitive channel n=1 Tax=Bdellovibrio reynosensis TaxID=2835041 RepID=A0ABY4CEB6_9BACT|nr:large conductance mechanosensitive channel protein MscL [Bdellovibrio reynosensis]UOF00550.1 large conductance mechanosensitive channel protein MscL [Bdellovibrio reynosensis]
MFKEFKAFIMKGNVLDLAVGIIIGAAFGKIVSSFVSDILMPVLSLGMGKVDFSNIFVSLDGKTYATLEEAKKAGAATLNFGIFTNFVIDFLIVAFAVFLIVRTANRLKKEEVPAAPNTKLCPECLSNVPIGARKCAYCTSALG